MRRVPRDTPGDHGLLVISRELRGRQETEPGGKDTRMR